MSEKAPYDLDAALEALARAERSARPAVPERLWMRVLADAAEVSAGRSLASATPVRRSGTRWRGWRGWRGWVGGIDLPAGAAVAVALICLAVGLGLGYGAGDTVLAEIGFDSVRLAQASDDDALFLSEDVL